MQRRNTELYLVTITTAASIHESTVTDVSLHRAACTGVAERGLEVDSSAWIRRPLPNGNAHRLLALESSDASIRVTAEALTY